ncbi:3-phosphoglycerate dehydrogenase [Candidatus Micrarchaeota archaeon]|nr:3-phosphoglycerate dehydrogenase [Candidatus Micrarchaeota archaeon]
MLIVISDNMEKEAVEEIEKAGRVVFRPENLEGAIKEADVLVVRSATMVTGELLSKAEKLKMVARAGIGLDNIDRDACREKGIRVVNTPGASTNAVAELTLCLAMASMRNVQKAHHQMKNEIWDKKHLVGREIQGKTLGIVGYGRIGSLLAEKADALGMKILASDPHPREGAIAEFVGLDRLFAESDVISLHVPLVEETRNMINRESIGKMKEGAFIINTARGQIIDEDALYEGCKSGRIGGAAIDVYWEEPYRGKLLELDNVYLTPHLGASTKEAQIRIGKEIAGLISKAED